MRIRIPRTKRQIDLIAAKRKLRKQAKQSNIAAQHNLQGGFFGAIISDQAHDKSGLWVRK